jgi:hypothetical protein
MKYFLVTLAFLVSGAANANICGKFMTCGTFEGSSVSGAAEGIHTTIVIKPVGHNRAKFIFTLTKAGEEPGVWDLDVKFRRDGAFIMTDKNGVYAAGICEYPLCTYGMHPITQKNGDVTGNAGILTFKGDQLQLLMTFGLPANVDSDLSTLQKQ